MDRPVGYLIIGYNRIPKGFLVKSQDIPLSLPTTVYPKGLIITGTGNSIKENSERLRQEDCCKSAMMDYIGRSYLKRKKKIQRQCKACLRCRLT